MNEASQREKVSTRFYDGQIPAFAEGALDALYGSLYSSLPQLALGNLSDVGTYAAFIDDRVHALLLYARHGRELRVINEGMSITAEEAAQFAQQAFERDPAIRSVRFHAIRLNGTRIRYPAWQLPVTEDIVLDLPASEEAYLSSLGKATRKTLRQNLTRAASLSHTILDGDKVDATLVDAIIGFNHARMAGKQRASAIDAGASRQLLTLLRARGMVGVVSINGQPCAGTLDCRIGDDIYSLVNAHDPAVNHLGMGNVSRHLMILAAIHSGAKRFHLLGGHFASKRSCGAQRLPLDDLKIYRNHVAMLVDVVGITMIALRSADYRLRVAIEDSRMRGGSSWSARMTSLSGRVAHEAAQALRKLTSAQ